jgi:hypothetical protein
MMNWKQFGEKQSLQKTQSKHLPADMEKNSEKI